MQTPIIGQRIVPVGYSTVQGTPIVKHSTDFVTAEIPQQAIVPVAKQPITTYSAINHVATGPLTYAAGFPYPYVSQLGLQNFVPVQSAANIPAAVEVKTA